MSYEIFENVRLRSTPFSWEEQDISERLFYHVFLSSSLPYGSSAVIFFFAQISRITPRQNTNSL